MPEKKNLNNVLRDEIINLLIARYGEKQDQTATLSYILNKMWNDLEILDDYREGNL